MESVFSNLPSGFSFARWMEDQMFWDDEGGETEIKVLGESSKILEFAN